MTTLREIYDKTRVICLAQGTENSHRGATPQFIFNGAYYGRKIEDVGMIERLARTVTGIGFNHVNLSYELPEDPAVQTKWAGKSPDIRRILLETERIPEEEPLGEARITTPQLRLILSGDEVLEALQTTYQGGRYIPHSIDSPTDRELDLAMFHLSNVDGPFLHKIRDRIGL